MLGAAGTSRSNDAQDIPCALPWLQSGFADGMVVGVIVLRAVAAVSVQLLLMRDVNIVAYPDFWHNPVSGLATQIHKHPEFLRAV